MVKEAILEGINKIAENPKIFERDVLKKDKDPSFRAFIVYHTRITYEMKQKEIIVHRVRHTSREPLMH